jgi:hypothetical protein
MKEFSLFFSKFLYLKNIKQKDIYRILLNHVPAVLRVNNAHS